ncbi:MAG: Rdx family protein [Thermodesulfovibrionales bacterium]
MKISIEYCGICNYRPIAAVLAVMIERETGVKPALVHSSSAGAYEVTVDGVLVHSKHMTGAFPDNEEIASRIKFMQKQGPQRGPCIT